MPQPSLEADFRPGRRDLMRAGGAAFLLGIQFSTKRVVAAPTSEIFAPDAFIRITASGEVTLIMPQVEMGQGIYTALAMLIAEELDLAMDAITLEAAPANEALYFYPILKIQATGGSTSIPAFYEPLRLAGATARAMLVSSAAQRWVVASDECRTEAGRVFHDGTKRSASYGELVPTVARHASPARVMLKKPSSFRLIGMPQRQLDTAAKVNGALKYGIDAMPDGVKYATMTASPVPEGTLATVDDSQIGSVAGVRQVLRFDDMVAVVGDHSWAALRGLAALSLIWNDGRFATLSSESLRADLNEAVGGQPMTVKDQGHALDLLRGAGVTAQSYEFPMLAHAPMEPMNCTVHVTSERCEVWVGTQVLARAQQAAAEEADLVPEQVVIHNHLLGGGFGRRLKVDFIRRAVRIARRVDGPVKVFWSREEDISSAMYRPIYGVWLSAKLDRGRPVAWRHLIAGPAIAARWLPEAYDGGKFIDAVDGADELPYHLPNFRLEYVRHELPAIPTCFWRGIAPNVNVFAVESFIDRLAREAHTDPVAFRRQLLDKSPRARVVLDLAAEKARWRNELPARSGRGISLPFAFGSYLATVAEVAVDDDGGVSVKRLLCVVDCGTVVNPDGVVAQIQGGLVFGLSAVLHGEITVRKAVSSKATSTTIASCGSTRCPKSRSISCEATSRRAVSIAERSAEWNRGAYLVEAAAHCGECHTPRNLMQAMDTRRKFAGGVAEGWNAYNISADPAGGVGKWSSEALADYLARGFANGHGSASGPMGEAVRLSLSKLAATDIMAMVAYLQTVPAITTAVVGWVTHLVLPDLPLAACFALGAIVSPPDAVAAKAVLRGLPLPSRTVTLLEGESLLNDATGLVLYRLAVASALTGTFDGSAATGSFILLFGGGALLGVTFGFLASIVTGRLLGGELGVAASFLAAWGSYIVGETLHSSGVLATVACGIVMGWRQHTTQDAEQRFQSRAVWRVIGFLLESLVFILIGLTLRSVLLRMQAGGVASLDTLLQVGGVVLAVIVSRFLWIIPATYGVRAAWPSLRRRDPYPPFRNPLVMSWCGMRGVVSLAAALALPAGFPGRDFILLASFAVILVTVLVQGATLAPLVRWLGFDRAVPPAYQTLPEGAARRNVVAAELARVKAISLGQDGSSSHPRLVEQLQFRLDAITRSLAAGGALDGIRTDHFNALLAAAAAGRIELIRMFKAGEIDNDGLRALEQEIDADEIRARHLLTPLARSKVHSS